MGSCKHLALFISIVVLGLAFHLYSPVPSGLEEPWLTRTFIAAFKLANMIASTVEALSGIPAVQVLRWQVEALYIPMFDRRSDQIVQIQRFDGIPVRIYRPKDSLSHLYPCVVYFHGGGWSLFSVDSYDIVTSRLSQETNMVVVSVDYRRAPENPYPIPFDDCVKATRRILQNGQAHGIDSHRVAVAGDGVGSSLAVAVALRLSEEDPSTVPPIKLQILIQPALQAFSFDTPSYRQNAMDVLVDRSQMIKFWCEYLGVTCNSTDIESFAKNQHLTPGMRRSIFSLYVAQNRLPESIKRNYIESSLDKYTNEYNSDLVHKVEGKVVDPFVSPLLAEDLTKVPPTYIWVAEYDVCRDDGLFLASRLQEANVKVSARYIENQSQGFLAPLLDSSFFQFNGSDAVWQEIYKILWNEL